MCIPLQTDNYTKDGESAQYILNLKADATAVSKIKEGTVQDTELQDTWKWVFEDWSSLLTFTKIVTG